MITLKNFLVALFITLTPSLFAGTGAWELEKNESGIKIYTRTVDGQDIREFKAIAVLAAPLKKIEGIILNVSDYHNWYPDITKASIVKRVSPTEYYVYNTLDLPWPADDRDGVSKLKITRTANSTLIKLESASGIKAESSDYVRIKHSYGFWKLETVGTKTKVHFQYFANPSGSLPDWIINMFIVDNPFETFKAIKKKLGI